MLAFLRSTKCCLCGGWWSDAEVAEERLHADAEGLVVAVDGGPVRWHASAARAAHAREDGGDDLVAEGEKGGDGAGRSGRGVVAAGPARVDGEVLAAELAQVVGALPDRVAGVLVELPGVGGDLGDGEAMWCGCEGRCRRQGGADAGLVQVDAAGAGRAEPGGQRQLVEEAVGDEADVGAVQDVGEPVGHAGEAGGDLGGVIQAAAAAQFFGGVGGGPRTHGVIAPWGYLSR